MGDAPTRSYLPIVYHQCRDRQALKSSGYEQFYRTYFNIRGRSTEDSSLADIQYRLSRRIDNERDRRKRAGSARSLPSLAVST
jgi:hypothetical protein